MEPQPTSGGSEAATRRAPLVWALFGLTVVCFAPALWLAATQRLWDFGLENLVWALSIVAFASMGALVASRRPANAVGWLLLVGALLVSSGLLGVEYATRALLIGGVGRPLQEITAWSGMILFASGVVLLLPGTALHFPDGRLPSARWRWLRLGMGLLAGGSVVISALAPGTLSLGSWRLTGDTRNPLALDLPALAGLQDVVIPVFLTVVVVGFTAPYWRMRHARGEERQQIKWFVYATAVMAAGLVTTGIVSAARPGEQAGEVAVNAISALGFMALPVAIGVAVLKYRLYEIDLVINRTLVYAMLSLLLGAVYGIGVVLLPLLLPIAGGNDLVVAASTLTVAGLFSPLRRRVQGFVDRNFYRARYDAAETMESFATRIRHDVDVEQLADDLMAIVQVTLQPAAISLSMTHMEEGRRTPA